MASVIISSCYQLGSRMMLARTYLREKRKIAKHIAEKKNIYIYLIKKINESNAKS